MEGVDFLQSTVIALNIFFFYLTLYVFFLPFEITFPAERGHSLRARLKNVRATFIFLLLGVVIADIALVSVTKPQIYDTEFLTVWNGLVVLFYIFVLDFLFYWYHRAEHTFSWFWPMHELHHSDRELNATTSYRTFWLERPMQALLIGIPAGYAIGNFEIAFTYALLLLSAWEFFNHANIRITLGPLTPVVSGPQLHRIHHSILPQHQNKNFAQYFPVIDIIFGTYRAPKRGEFPPTGLDGVSSDVTLADVLARPFMLWIRLIRETRKG